jgi:hypothetical protein
MHVCFHGEGDFDVIKLVLPQSQVKYKFQINNLIYPLQGAKRERNAKSQGGRITKMQRGELLQLLLPPTRGKGGEKC